MVILRFVYRWKVDGREINTESDLNYSLVEGNLVINNPHVINHGGVYQCIATNTFGTVVSREAKVQFACESILMLIFEFVFCYTHTQLSIFSFKYIESKSNSL